MALFDSSDMMSEAQIEELFSSDEGNLETEKNESPKEKEEKEKQTTTESLEFDPENPLGSESVGSEDKTKEEEDTQSNKGTSPYVLSSLAKALKGEGILLDLEDDELDKIDSTDAFRAVIEKQIKAQLSDVQKRVDEALGVGVEPSAIKHYENTLAQLNTITDQHIEQENEQGENLRKTIIIRDYLNRGFSKERAEREANRAVSNGTDVDDAKEALKSIKDSVQGQYDDAIKQAKKADEEETRKRNKEAEDLKKSILEGKELFGDLELDKATRSKILENITKPIYKDPSTGDTYTALQKYELEHNADFLIKAGIIFTLTDGFKNLNGLIKGKVDKGVKKGLQEVENMLNNTQRNTDGSLNFAAGSTDTESFLKNFSLDI